MIIFLFGQPGSGKNYVGEIIQKHFNFYFYDADIDLTSEMKEAIQNDPKSVTDTMRDAYYSKVYERIKVLLRSNSRVVVAQAFTTERYRNLFQKYFPEAVFIYIEAPIRLINERLEQRGHFVKKLQATKLRKIYEQPKIEHIIFNNNKKGEQETKLAIESVLKDILT